MGTTLILLAGAVECLIVVFFVGRKSRKRIEALEKEVKRLNENPFIHMGNHYE